MQNLDKSIKKLEVFLQSLNKWIIWNKYQYEVVEVDDDVNEHKTEKEEFNEHITEVEEPRTVEQDHDVEISCENCFWLGPKVWFDSFYSNVFLILKPSLYLAL